MNRSEEEEGRNNNRGLSSFFGFFYSGFLFFPGFLFFRGSFFSGFSFSGFQMFRISEFVFQFLVHPTHAHGRNKVHGALEVSLEANTTTLLCYPHVF